MSLLGTIAVAVASLGLTSLFSGAETGFMSASRVRLWRQTNPGAARVKRLLTQLRRVEDPILTCLIGTNLTNVTFTAVVTSALTQRFAGHGEWLSVLVSSVVIITLGEIVPKVLFREFPERYTLWALPAVSVAAVILTPVRWALLLYMKLWERVLPADDETRHHLDRRGLAALLLANTDGNAGEQRFTETLNRFLQLAGRPLRGIMQPLGDLVHVTPETTVGECLQVAARSGFSRLPIAMGDSQGVQAYVLVRDLIFLPRDRHGEAVPRSLWRSFLLVDERVSPYEIFEEMRSQGGQVAIIVDPVGNPLGLLTLEDLIETVVGSVKDEFDET